MDVSRTIRFGEGTLVGTFTPLIPFSCIYDIPVGLLILIRKEYRSGDIFNLEKLDTLCMDRRQLIYNLYKRQLENPLIEFMNTPNYELAEDYYKQFISKEYSSIIDNSVHTGIYELCTYMKSSPEIRLTIYCESDLERDIIKNDPNLDFATIISKSELAEKVNRFEHYFINTLYGSYINLLMQNIDHKNIYILDYNYNFDQEEKGKLIDAPSVVGFEATRNVLSIINAYDISRLLRKE